MRIRFRLPGMFLLGLALASSAAGQAAPAAAPQRWARLGDFRLDNGAVIRDCRLGYRVAGKLNSARSNAILWPSWFTGTAGSLLNYAGPGRMLDPGKYFIIFVDALGDGVSSSPSNSRLQPGLRFPRFSVRDMVRSEHRLAAQVLHLPHLLAVMGISKGGMQSFQWAVSYPGYVSKIIPIVGSPRPAAYDRLLWRTGIEIIRHSRGFDRGAYRHPPPLPALWDLTSLNLTTRSYRNRRTSLAAFPAWHRRIEHPAAPFDADNWLRQAQAMMRLDVARPYGDSMRRAVARVRARMLIVPSARDHMVTPGPAEAFYRLLPAGQGRLLLLRSDCGHTAPGCEAARLAAAVRRMLRGAH